MSNENAEQTVENETNNVGGNDNIDWEKRALRAEAKIVADKKEAKEAPAVEEPKEKEEEAPKAEPTPPEVPTKTIEELEKQIADLKIEQNQATSNMMGVSGQAKENAADGSYTIGELEKMSQSDYEKAMKLVRSGQAVLSDED